LTGQSKKKSCICYRVSLPFLEAHLCYEIKLLHLDQQK
jgi:hypothetical protein